MHRLIVIFFILLSILSCQKAENIAEDPQTDSQNNNAMVERRYRPFLHNFTSTGCGVCARFGIPVFEEVASSMGDSILSLMTHFKYNDPFINESSLAIEKAVLQHYSSPQIWIENEEITQSILGQSIEQAAERCKEELRAGFQQATPAYLGLHVEQNASGRFDVDLAIENADQQEHKFFIEVYGHEDSIWASQSGIWPPPHHFYVNRGGYYGDMGREIILKAGEIWGDQFEYIPCTACKIEKMYFIAIVWKLDTNGRTYRYVNGIIKDLP